MKFLKDQEFKSKRVVFLLKSWITIILISFSFNATSATPTSSTLAFDQQEITGTVTDADGSPLPGVNIVISGTSTGTQTDFDGNFSINASEGDVLQFSYIGMVTQNITVGTDTVLTVVLEMDSNKLDEVVVIGYGTQKKKEVTGAVVQVEGEALTKAPVSNLSSTLTGRLPGLTVLQTSAEPGRESSVIRIRGNSTTGDNSALIVIDGVANADGLDRLDPNDIESVSVLKDASAAIYGAQAANGVVLVTTKRGRVTKPIFDLSFNYGINSPIGLMEVANGLEYATYLNRRNWRSSGWSDDYVKEYTDEEVESIRNGTTPDYDWVDKAFNDTFGQSNTTLSVRGGGEKMSYFASARYMDQESVYYLDEEGGNQQYNVRSNLDLQVNDRLKVGLDLNFRQQNVATSGGAFTGSIQTAGLTNPLKEFYLNGDTRYPAYGRFGQSPLSMNNGSGYYKNEINNTGVRLHFNWDLPWVEGLGIGGWGSANITSDFGKNWRTPWYWYSENPAGANETPIQNEVGTTNLYESYNRGRILTGNLNVTYNRSFGDHNLDVLVQAEQQQIRRDWFGAGNDDYLSASSDQLDSGSGDRAASWVNGSAAEAARIGYMGYANYNYKGKYFGRLIMRYDGSERFAEGERWGFFPGITAGWVMSEEDFLKDSNVFSFLKLRGSWGQVGNDRIGDFNYLSLYTTGGNTVVDGSLSPGYVEAGAANPDVTWEVHETINLGFDVSFFQNKLYLEFDIFKTDVSNLLAQANLTVPNYLGIQIPDTNIGEMENKGFEIAASYKDVIGDWSFEVGGNVGYAKNKIIDIDEPEWEYDYQAAEGYPFGSSLRYHAIGIFRTQEDLANNPTRPGDALGSVMIQDTNGDGVINADDRIRNGTTTLPTTTYGIIGRVAWKGISLDMLWQGSAGAEKRIWTFFSPENNAMAYFANHTWDPDHVNAEWPAPDQGFHDSDFYYFANDYIRLKTLELSYSFPSEMIQKIGLQNLRIYTSGYNLLTFSSIDKYGMTDPEQTSDLTWDYPMLKTYNFGLNITF